QLRICPLPCTGRPRRRRPSPTRRSSDLLEHGAGADEGLLLDALERDLRRLDLRLQRLDAGARRHQRLPGGDRGVDGGAPRLLQLDRKSTRLNSSHVKISYAVFCLKKKKQ